MSKKSNTKKMKICWDTFFLKKDKPLLGLRGRGAEPHTVLRKSGGNLKQKYGET